MLGTAGEVGKNSQTTFFYELQLIGASEVADQQGLTYIISVRILNAI